MDLKTCRLGPGFLSDRLTIARKENAICKRRSRMTYDPNFTGMTNAMSESFTQVAGVDAVAEGWRRDGDPLC